MNGLAFTLQLRILSNTPPTEGAPLSWDSARMGCRTEAIASLPLAFIGQRAAFWYRSLWLDPAFWEQSPKHSATPSGSRSNSAAPVWIEIRLFGPDQRATFQVTGPADLPFLKHGGEIHFPKKLVFPISDGQLSLPPIHIRLPPDLKFKLTHNASNNLHLDLIHPLLGPFFSAHIQQSICETTKEPIPC
jgi:hypothetical protein